MTNVFTSLTPTVIAKLGMQWKVVAIYPLLYLCYVRSNDLLIVVRRIEVDVCVPSWRELNVVKLRE